MDATRKHDLLVYLVKRLVKERLDNGGFMPNELLELMPPRGAEEGASTQDLWLAFRALVNVREPWPVDHDLLAAQDELLQGLIAEAGITAVGATAASPLDPRLRLWRGDITTLAAGAIVNAANDGMTGCWAPLHYCIDNAIHTFAGIQLRLECARLMREQGHPEPTGRAKVTPAYNLPSRHVIHTVGRGRRDARAARLELSQLPGRCGRSRRWIHRAVLHQHRGVRLPRRGGGAPRRGDRPRLARRTRRRRPPRAHRRVQRVQGIGRNSVPRPSSDRLIPHRRSPAPATKPSPRPKCGITQAFIPHFGRGLAVKTQGCRSHTALEPVQSDVALYARFTGTTCLTA